MTPQHIHKHEHEGENRLVSVPKDDLDSLEATVETLQDERVMQQLQNSDEDIVEDRVRDARDFVEELGE